MKDNNKTNTLTNVLFIIYLITLFWIILFKLNVPFSNMENIRKINLIPFSDINGEFAFSEIIMNVMIFVPLGIYSGILFKRWIFRKKLFLFFLISLICEGCQFILGVGVSDITDIINNTLGGIIGLMIYIGIEKVFKNSVKAQKFINIIATIGTILIILVLLLLINNLTKFRLKL